jgi:hypothetical protein
VGEELRFNLGKEQNVQFVSEEWGGNMSNNKDRFGIFDRSSSSNLQIGSGKKALIFTAYDRANSFIAV